MRSPHACSCRSSSLWCTRAMARARRAFSDRQRVTRGSCKVLQKGFLCKDRQPQMPQMNAPTPDAPALITIPRVQYDAFTAQINAMPERKRKQWKAHLFDKWGGRTSCKSMHSRVCPQSPPSCLPEFQSVGHQNVFWRVAILIGCNSTLLSTCHRLCRRSSAYTAPHHK